MSAEKDLTQRNGEAESTARRAPALRFKGFDDEWKVKSLGKIATMFAGGTPLSSVGEYYGGDISWVSISDMTSAGKYILETEKKLTLLGFESCSAKMFPENTLLFAMYASIGKCCISPCPVASSQAILGIHKLKGVEIEFLYQELVARESEFVKMGQTGSQANLSKQIVENISIYLPSLPEQRKIGACFRALDGLIAGREEALGKLLDLKKAMLERMFPQGARRVPEVRFKGFDDEWEVKSLGKIATRITRKNTKLESDLPLTISAEHGLINQCEYFNNRVAPANVANYYLINNGEFAYNKSASDGSPFGAVKRLDRYAQGVLSTLYIVFGLKPGQVDSEYVARFFDTPLWHEDVAERAEEGARCHGLLNITADDFFETKIRIPVSKSEQRKIGAYFQALDGLIAARREEVGKLKELKKAMLGRMFA